MQYNLPGKAVAHATYVPDCLVRGMFNAPVLPQLYPSYLFNRRGEKPVCANWLFCTGLPH
jgi:hypothetical protein